MITQCERELTASEREEWRRTLSSDDLHFAWRPATLLGGSIVLAVVSFVLIRQYTSGGMLVVIAALALGSCWLVALAAKGFAEGGVQKSASAEARRHAQTFLDRSRLLEVQVELDAAWSVPTPNVHDDTSDGLVLVRVGPGLFALLSLPPTVNELWDEDSLRSRLKFSIRPQDGHILSVSAPDSSPRIGIDHRLLDASGTADAGTVAQLPRFEQLATADLPEVWQPVIAS